MNCFFFSSRRRHTRYWRDWSSDVCSSDLPFALSLPTVSKHLKVLQQAGLISQGRRAQWRPCRLEAAPLQAVATWAEEYRRFWDESVDRLDAYLQELQAQEKEQTP